MKLISDEISLDLLRAYLAVCRQGSMSRVAAQTGRTQPALSMQMRRLEDLTGQRLLLRTGRGVRPTAEGEVFANYATRILALGDEAVARLQPGRINGELRIGLAEETATVALPAALGRLHRLYPGIRLDVTVDDSVALGQHWCDGGLDLMIAPTSVVATDALAGWNVELQWVGSSQKNFDPDLSLDFISFAAPCLWRQRALDALSAIGRDYRITLTSKSIMALQAAVESGLGVGLLPSEAIRPGAMRILGAAAGAPMPLLVQYGLYAADRRTQIVDAAIDVLLAQIPDAAFAASLPPG